MRVGIYYSISNNQSVQLVGEFKNLLSQNHIEFVDIKQTIKEKESVDKVDLFVVFGGDGTVLSGAKIAGEKPIVAINTGTLGFLTAFEKDSLTEVVEHIKNNTLTFSNRRVLQIKVGNKKYYALNDGVILKDFQKNNYSCCVKLNLEIDGKKVDKYVADGLIISTPTGSTAYALSAGAPVISPELEAIIVAPICSHSLHSRPIVFSPKSTALVTVDNASKDCALYIDGQMVQSIEAGEKIQIILDEKCVKICENCNNFFEKLSKKIASWTNQQ